MLTRLREIVEKVASAPRLNEALNILVTDICLAMDTEVCSVYLADHDRRCYYLMATRGLKKPRGRTVALAFDEGIVGLVGRLAEPINLADAQKHPSFKYIPSVKEERFRAFLGVPIIQRRQLMVRALGIPTVMGADIQPSVLHRRTLVVDGYRGELLVDPEPVLIQEYQRLISEEIELSRLAEDDVNLPAQLKSGERVKVMLNAGLSPEHEEKLGSRIDGIGLYRTEIPFMLQSGFPSEEEQVAQYQGMLQMFNDKPVTLRTLDVGADKQLPYMPISEENPCLGWRGIRITLDQPEIFLIQVRAMLRANAATGNLSILLPMVTSIDEVDEARRLIERAGREVEEMIGYAIPKPRIGIMLEVPSMVFMLPHLANRIDFISVGTNDLTQYILAVDRNNTRVASIYDSLHPAMLRALSMIAQEAEKHGLDLRLCGEMAGDPMCVAILIGLGYRHLSMNGRSVARVKYLLRHIDFEDAQTLARRSLEAQMATEVRHQVAAFMERRGMGGLIRGGL
ncbi:phosphoenolpyruvate-protein phosphotransferase PtsP [Salmonella enterica]|nr:phosphoenolpyruvate-protein phosphotransferase PtsP [Salmonella enterica]